MVVETHIDVNLSFEKISVISLNINIENHFLGPHQCILIPTINMTIGQNLLKKPL